MNKNILFDKYFFDHLRDYSKISNFTHKFVVFLLEKRCIVKIIIIFESFLGIVLNLRVPVYSSVIKFTAENLEGLPRFYGCYFRSLYYSKKLKALNSNVIIEKGVYFQYPSNVVLSEFSFIDRNVHLMSENTFVGRRVHLAPFVFVSGGGTFEIHDYACMAMGACAITSSESLRQNTRSSGPMVPFHQRDVIKGSVIIKKDAFISVGVKLLTNTVVEEGVVIAANTVSPFKSEQWNIYSNVDSSKRLVRSKKVKRRTPLKLDDF
jgi:acetyltransferase-like isoleucine patch superfamily enzyme